MSEKFPPTGLYAKFLNEAVTKFNITLDEARDKYGLYSIIQWEELLYSDLLKWCDLKIGNTYVDDKDNHIYIICGDTTELNRNILYGHFVDRVEKPLRKSQVLATFAGKADHKFFAIWYFEDVSTWKELQPTPKKNAE